MNEQPRKSPIEKIEEGIVEALKDAGLSSKYLIALFPDNPDQFDISDAEKAALVQYAGSRYRPPENVGATQMRSAEFAVHLFLRQVSTPVRGPREIEAIRLALQGRRIEGTQLVVTRDGLIDQEGPLWRYVIEVACELPAVAVHPAPVRPFISDFSKQGGA